jgi:uncharacterized protein (TIGR03435 family)
MGSVPMATRSRRISPAIRSALGLGTLITLSMHAQSLPQSPSSAKRRFEVASVKPCARNTVRGTFAGSVDEITVRYNCQTLVDYVREAYTGWVVGRFLRSTRIEKGPPWVNRDLYEISAKSDSPMKGTAFAEMMQALLEDRFKLKVHKETREVPVFALVAAKAGIRLPAAKTPCYTRSPDGPPPPRPKPGERVELCGRGQETQDGIEVHGATMADFCLSLSNMPFRLDRRIFVDKTGVSGRFDFDLKFQPEIPAEPGATPGPPDDFARLQDALRPVGLRLTFAKGTDDVLVIDHAEPPTPN